jgi:hypothetical protein
MQSVRFDVRRARRAPASPGARRLIGQAQSVGKGFNFSCGTWRLPGDCRQNIGQNTVNER